HPASPDSRGSGSSSSPHRRCQRAWQSPDCPARRRTCPRLFDVASVRYQRCSELWADLCTSLEKSRYRPCPTHEDYSYHSEYSTVTIYQHQYRRYTTDRCDKLRGGAIWKLNKSTIANNYCESFNHNI